MNPRRARLVATSVVASASRQPKHIKTVVHGHKQACAAAHESKPKHTYLLELHVHCNADAQMSPNLVCLAFRSIGALARACIALQTVGRWVAVAALVCQQWWKTGLCMSARAAIIPCIRKCTKAS